MRLTAELCRYTKRGLARLADSQRLKTWHVSRALYLSGLLGSAWVQHKGTFSRHTRASGRSWTKRCAAVCCARVVTQ